MSSSSSSAPLIPSTFRPSPESSNDKDKANNKSQESAEAEAEVTKMTTTTWDMRKVSLAVLTVQNAALGICMRKARTTEGQSAAQKKYCSCLLSLPLLLLLLLLTMLVCPSVANFRCRIELNFKVNVCLFAWFAGPMFVNSTAVLMGEVVKFFICLFLVFK